MPFNRFDDGPFMAYHSFILSRAHTSFAWGTNDCATFAADGLLAITGNDPLRELRGTYSDALGALRVAKDATGSSDLLEAVTFIAEKNNFTKRDNPLLAQRGDLVLVEQADGKLICALVGLSGRWCLAPGTDGLQHIPLTSVRHTWTY